MKLIAPLALSALLALLPGCMLTRRHRNVPLDPAGVEHLTPGQSTAKDVVDVLGAPTDVVQLGRRTAYRYDYMNEKEARLWLVIINVGGIDSQADRLWAFFDESQVLTHVGSTLDGRESRFRIPPFD